MPWEPPGRQGISTLLRGYNLLRKHSFQHARASSSKCFRHHKNSKPQPTRYPKLQGPGGRKEKEVNLLQQPNSCNPIPAQGVGELVTLHLPSLHSSPLRSHFALPYLLAGDKTHELQPPTCSPQQTPRLLYKEHY